MARSFFTRLFDGSPRRPAPLRHPGRAALAAGMLAVILGGAAVVAVAQGRSPESLPAPAQDALTKRLGEPLVFAIAVGHNGRIEPAPGQNVTVRELPEGYRPPADKITKTMTITVIEYEKNSHCYVYYHAGSPVEYCPQH